MLVPKSKNPIDEQDVYNLYNALFSSLSYPFAQLKPAHFLDILFRYLVFIDITYN